MAELPIGMSIHAAAAVAAAAFAMLTAYALGGRWRTPYERAGVLGVQNRTIALALASLLWVGAEWMHAQAGLDRLTTTGVLREGSDWARQVAICMLLLHLLSPNQALSATAHGRKVQWICAAVLSLGLAGAAAHALQPQLLGLLAWLPTMATVVMLMALLEQVLRNAQADDRWSVAPLVLGLGLGQVFDLYRTAEAVLLGSPVGGPDLLRVLVHALGVPLIGLAIRRQVGRDARMRVSRQVVFYTGALSLAGGVLMMMAAAGTWVRYFNGDWGPAVQVLGLALGAAAVAMLGLSGTLRAQVRVWVTKHFFHYRYDYREQWLRYTTMLAGQTSPGEVGVQVVRGLADMGECTGASVWLRSTGAQGQAVYAMKSHWNVPALPDHLDEQAELPAFMLNTGWVIDLQEWREHRSRYAALNAMPEWLMRADQDARIVVPLSVSGQTLDGFVVLNKPRAVVDVDWEVRDLLKTAARQAASYLAYMNATSELLEARKFEAFNRMSAFVVHDLKNIVTQLSLMMRNAQRLQDNPAFRADMLMTVESSLEKMRRLMTQLREGADGETARPVDLAAMMVRLQMQARQRGRTVELRSAQRLATRGSPQRLERVLGHLVDNALDATSGGGQVWLELQAGPSQACVVVGDTGKGMSPEFMQNRLFRAFSSTKPEGMGIGLHESLSYVRELGGRIEPSSTVGQGTVMKVWLPLLQADLDAALPLEVAA